MESLQTEHQGRIEAAQVKTGDELQSRMSEMRKNQEADLASLKQEHEARVGELQVALQQKEQEMEQQKAAAEAGVREIQQDCQVLQAEHTSEVSGLQSTITAMEEKHANSGSS